MKKLLAFLLLVCLALPLCHAEEIDESQYVGTWVYTDETINNGLTMEVMYLTEDHRVFYIYQTFDAEKSTYSKRYTGTWSFLEEDIIQINIGNGFLTLRAIPVLHSILMTAHDSGAEYKWFIALGSDMMTRTADDVLQNTPTPTKAPKPTPEPTPVPPDGMRVPQGEYIIGEYIQPGFYRITLVGDDLAVIWRYKKGNSIGSYYSLVYSKGETEAMLRLEDGDVFKVEHASVILSEIK